MVKATTIQADKYKFPNGVKLGMTLERFYAEEHHLKFKTTYGLYIATDRANKPYSTKIGFGKPLSARISNYKTFAFPRLNQFKIYAFATKQRNYISVEQKRIENARYAERRLHDTINEAGYKNISEWFNVTPRPKSNTKPTSHGDPLFGYGEKGLGYKGLEQILT